MSRQIYIIRHGNTFDKGDVVTRVGARTDLPLSNSGQAQADALASLLAERVTQFDAAYCSPLLRTQQTAKTILAAQSNPPALTLVDFLREIDYGPDENQPEDDVIARIGQDALNLWESDAIAPDGWQVSPAQLIQAWKDLFAKTAAETDKTGPVLVVTSNGVARFALQAIGNTGEHALKLKTGAFGIIEASAHDDLTILEWNVRP